MNDLPNRRIYYAQNREDLILESFFRGIKKGFYIDVGACHPHVASVTKRFYQQGWSGINIEPQKNLYELFINERKRDINLNLGISDKAGLLTIRSYTNNQGLSTMAQELISEYEKFNSNNTDAYEDLPVKVATLESVLSEYQISSIQFLKVDVEGYEYEVLNGNDWSKYRPEVLCIESNHVVRDWRPLLRRKGYSKVFFDGLNEYYVDQKASRRIDFEYVDHVLLDLKGGISADDLESRSDAMGKRSSIIRIINRLSKKS
jgi:FkbM family methyltransferase